MKIIPHTPYKVEKDRFRSLTNSIIAKKLVSTNLERFLIGINLQSPECSDCLLRFMKQQ